MVSAICVTWGGRPLQLVRVCVGGGERGWVWVWVSAICVTWGGRPLQLVRGCVGGSERVTWWGRPFLMVRAHFSCR